MVGGRRRVVGGRRRGRGVGGRRGVIPTPLNEAF
jgi:hypothetical protein